MHCGTENGRAATAGGTHGTVPLPRMHGAVYTSSASLKFPRPESAGCMRFSLPRSLRRCGTERPEKGRRVFLPARNRRYADARRVSRTGN